MSTTENSSRRSIPLGLRFHPTDLQAISHCLQKKINNEESFDFIEEIEIYAFEPWILPHKSSPIFRTNEWYYFARRSRARERGTRPKRVVNGSRWKATEKEKPIFSCDNQIIGHKQSLVFFQKDGSKEIKTGWLMKEYRLASASFQDLVLCHIRYKPQKKTNCTKPILFQPQQAVSDNDSQIPASNMCLGGTENIQSPRTNHRIGFSDEPQQPVSQDFAQTATTNESFGYAEAMQGVNGSDVYGFYAEFYKGVFSDEPQQPVVGSFSTAAATDENLDANTMQGVYFQNRIGFSEFNTDVLAAETERPSRPELRVAGSQTSTLPEGLYCGVSDHNPLRADPQMSGMNENLGYTEWMQGFFKDSSSRFSDILNARFCDEPHLPFPQDYAQLAAYGHVFSEVAGLFGADPEIAFNPELRVADDQTLNLQEGTFDLLAGVSDQNALRKDPQVSDQNPLREDLNVSDRNPMRQDQLAFVSDVPNCGDLGLDGEGFIAECKEIVGSSMERFSKKELNEWLSSEFWCV